MRFGALYVSNSKEQDITICADKLRSALEEDSRVQWVKGGIPEKHWDSTFVVSGGGWWPAELTGLPGRAEQASIGGSSSQGVTTDAHAEPTALARRPAHRVSSLLYPGSAVRRHTGVVAGTMPQVS